MGHRQIMLFVFIQTQHYPSRRDREYVHAPLHSMCGMAVPELVWVDMEASSSSPLLAHISDGLSYEVPLT